tara:strand:- start:12 stop:305 length:294 start_codon:yes stop_codon:yes gene_type:complete
VILVVVLIAVGFYVYNQDNVGLDSAECIAGNCKCGSNVGRCSVTANGNTAICYSVDGKGNCVKTTCTENENGSCGCTTEEAEDAECEIKKKGLIHSR